MGGRGMESGANIRQVTIEQHKDRIEVEEIIRKAEIARDKANAKEEKDDRIPMLYKKCCCCGEFTIPIDSEHIKCPVCGWIDDEFQNIHVNSKEGMNELCLVEAKKLYFESRKII